MGQVKKSSVFYRLFPETYIKRRVRKSLIEYKRSYLHLTGWYESWRQNKPLDNEGEIIPWMNYPAVHFLKSRLKPDQILFEYGSGFSTLFYAKRVKKVVSVEYDEVWYNQISKDLPKNAAIIFRNNDIDGQYCRAIDTINEELDVVIIDGRDRNNCLKQSVKKISGRGVIILDDSSRDKYDDGISFMYQKGYRSLEFEGLKPTGRGNDRTTFFYRDGNCFGI